MSINTILFDMDGTLTVPYLDFDLMRKEMGIDVNTKCILKLLDEMPAAKRTIAMEILHRHEATAAENATLNDNVHNTFESLRKQNIKIGILTRNTRKNTDLILDNHNIQVD